METIINVEVERDSIQQLREVSVKLGGFVFDLNTVPFNEFNCKLIMPKLSEDELESQLQRIATNVGNSKLKEMDLKKEFLDFVDKEVSETYKVVIKDNNFYIADIDWSITVNTIGSIDLTSNTENMNPNEIGITGLDVSPSPSIKAKFEKGLLKESEFYNMAFITFLDVVYLLHHITNPLETLVDVEKKTKLENKSLKKKSKKGSKKNNNSKSVLKTVVYKPIVNKEVKERIFNSKTFTRRTSEWYVRGYWRTNAQGKREFIQGGIRRAKDSLNTVKIIEKNYKVK